MDIESVLPFENTLESLDYNHAKHSISKRTKSIEGDLRKRVDNFLNGPLALPSDKNKEESDSLEGEEMEITILSNIIDIYNRLAVLLGLKLSDHTDTLTEASNLIDEL